MGAFMKKTTILTLITVYILSFASCGKQETTSGNESITATVESAQAETTVPEETETEESKTESLPWIPLSSLETHPELRAAFEEYVEVTGTTGNKEGNLYTNPLTTQPDQNITLLLAIKNQYFRGYMMVLSSVLKLGEMSIEYYADIDADYANAPYATINAYFELLPDQEDGQFDGDATISRAQAMALLMRATTPVNEAQAPEEDADFTKAVGETQYTNFAAPMNEYTYLNTSTGLNDKTFNTTMSRGEYIYLLTKYIYGDTYAQRMEEAAKEDETLSDDLSLTNIKDAGNISLQDAINNVENGLPTDMYQTLSRAVALGFVTEDNLNWDEAITKSEAITLFIDAAEVYYNTTKSTSTTTDDNIVVDDTTSSFEIVEQGDYPDSRSDHQANWDIYKNYFDDFSVYGTDTAGKGLNDLPYGGDTGYDPKGTILQERTTDKGYTVMYDTDTGKVYYSSMILPTGDVYNEITSGKALVQYILDNDIFSVYDLTYSQFQEILGIYNGD